MRYLLIVLAVVTIFTVFTTVFAASASKNEVRLLPKWIWILVCLLVPGVGGILYLSLGRPKPSAPGAGFGSGGRTRTVAPDDDPEFLRRLRERLSADDGQDESTANGSKDHQHDKDANDEQSPNDGQGPNG